jgi:hypothetical protein
MTSLLDIVPPQPSHCIEHGDFIDAYLDLTNEEYRVGFIHSATIGSYGLNKVQISKMFDVVTHIICDREAMNVDLVIECEDVECARIRLTDSMRPSTRFRIFENSNLPMCAFFHSNVFLEYKAFNDHKFTILGFIARSDEREEQILVREIMLDAGSTGHLLISDGGAVLTD